ncbi:MAG: ABC transporter ATP-binding protein [Prevotella sp.]|nr:ABC transporter ATP-binding protein [Prevotella sp.]MBP3826918.1 ABC transporter ATP-binding protein [Prevotella sp.]MBQ4146578.1 ABC transporter ATP-binding protein [Prevotella sp.]MBQ7441105.1 ABC transporter ATP-binding protein [Prevotella sp.]MBQ7717572.1 ABC transporter ATP-binding protein [Prevotella sp.]
MAIQVNDLKKTFGEKTAVNISEFTIHDGDILGLVGNNGAGKTTLFRLILDLIKADQGQVTINDCNPVISEEWKNFTGAYLDEGFLIDFLTPEEYFEFIAKVNNLSKEVLEERLKVFEHFMGGEIMGQKKLIRNLSAGNKQKVGIISALINKPQIVILDEPFNFLDPSSQNILKHLIEDLHKETNSTILISSHNLSHTIDISTRIALMENGVIIKDLSNDESGNTKVELENYFDTES